MSCFSVSMSQMQGEHKELIDRVNDFSEAVEAELSRSELEIRISRLIESFRSHFESEEDLMRFSSYPDLQRHADEHRRLLDQIAILREGVGSGSIRLCHALADFVRLWTEQHMTGLDAAFAGFMVQERSQQFADFES